MLLLDADTLLTVQEVAVDAVDGQYCYSFSDVPSGNYYVVAGSDSDSDYFVCDAGESCGSYPSAVSPSVLSLTEDTMDIDFTSSFGVQFNPAYDASGIQTGYSRLPMT